MAALLPPVTAVALGGVMAMLVNIAGAYVFPRVRRLDRLTDADVENAGTGPVGSG